MTDVGRGSERWTYLGPQGTFTEQAASMLADRLGGADSDIAGDIELEPVAQLPGGIALLFQGGAEVVLVQHFEGGIIREIAARA